MKHVLMTAIALATLTNPAYANEKVAADVISRISPSTGCSLKENVTVGANFNINALSMTEAKEKFDKKMKEIGDYAKQQGIKEEPQSLNYNIYSQNMGGYGNADDQKTYNLNGSISYQMSDSAQGFKFAEFLEKQKLTVNLNSNAYRSGNCNTGM